MSLVKIIAFTFILVNVQSVICEKKLFSIEKSAGDSDGKLLLVTLGENEDEFNIECDIISSGDKTKEALETADYPPVETISEDEMRKYLEDCDTVNDLNPEENKDVFNAPKKKTTKSDSETTTPGYDRMPIIFPGTKWCGAGDRAEDYDDLGLHQDTDRCCRAHDLCNDTLAPGELRNNLKNKSPFTKLSCQCDEDFYNCLSRVNSLTSNTIGNMYFNILKRDCYKEDYPDSDKCKKYLTIFKVKCIEYEKDTKAPKEYQWVKAKKYKKLPFPGPLTVTLPGIFP